MCKVNYEFIAVKYRVLGLDEPIPDKSFYKYEIDGKKYEPVPVYDLPGCIAIDDDGKSLMGKEVLFV
jgi:hypothetical protein